MKSISGWSMKANKGEREEDGKKQKKQAWKSGQRCARKDWTSLIHLLNVSDILEMYLHKYHGSFQKPSVIVKKQKCQDELKYLFSSKNVIGFRVVKNWQNVWQNMSEMCTLPHIYPSLMSGRVLGFRVFQTNRILDEWGWVDEWMNDY